VKFEFKAAIFDMDGTLLDSMRYWRLGAIEYLLKHQLPVPDEIYQSLFYQSTMRHLKRALEGMNLPFDGEAIWREICERMRRHYLEDISPKPHVREYLEALKGAGVRMCVATASPKDYACAALARHDLHGYFDFITDESGMGCTKKDEAFFHGLTDRLGVPMADCVMFEDALYSIRTAKSAGIRVWAIEEESMRYDRKEIMDLADRYVTGYRELIEGSR
jgi:HAD superfamily hydrolase (TIGR01509 family)